MNHLIRQVHTQTVANDSYITSPPRQDGICESCVTDVANIIYADEPPTLIFKLPYRQETPTLQSIRIMQCVAGIYTLIPNNHVDVLYSHVNKEGASWVVAQVRFITTSALTTLQSTLGCATNFHFMLVFRTTTDALQVFNTAVFTSKFIFHTPTIIKAGLLRINYSMDGGLISGQNRSCLYFNEFASKYRLPPSSTTITTKHYILLDTVLDVGASVIYEENIDYRGIDMANTVSTYDSYAINTVVTTEQMLALEAVKYFDTVSIDYVNEYGIQTSRIVNSLDIQFGGVENTGCLHTLQGSITVERSMEHAGCCS